MDYSCLKIVSNFFPYKKYHSQLGEAKSVPTWTGTTKPDP